ESSRDTDHALRARLAGEIERLKRNVEDHSRQLAERRVLDPLPALGRVCAKLDRLANLLRYAARGYHGVFDRCQLDETKLDELYAFDLGLLDELAAIESSAQAVHGALEDAVALQRATRDLDRTLDAFDQLFSKRALLLEAPGGAAG
ncbi:MAG: hypothetical protein A3J75_05165, partial [Acidobacteria bacterium RBG_16_68_9]